MITQKHGRKLASQLGEVLFVCQFYDFQIVKKIYLNLRNLWLHLAQMCVCVCPSSPQRHYTLFAFLLPVWRVGTVLLQSIVKIV